MKQYVLYKSKKGNRYIFDLEKKKNLLCHPVLYYLAELEDKGTDLEKWISELKEALEIQAVGAFTKEEIEYYYKKYLLLKRNGHFGDISREQSLGGKLTPEDVRELLANISQVTLETTEKCCFKCLYCGYGEFYLPRDARSEKSLEFSSVEKIFTYLLEYWNSPLNRSVGKNIYISFYGGEPLLNFKLIEDVVNYMKNLDLRHNRLTFSMTTNGVLLEKHIDFLVENEFNLLISLDGDETGNDYRVFKDGNPAFPAIMENIAALRSKYPDYFARKVSFNAVIHNKNSIAGVYRFFKEQFGKIPRIASLNSFGIREEQKQAFREMYSNLDDSLYKNEDYSLIQREMFINLPNIQVLSDFLHTHTDFCFINYNDLLYETDDKTRFPTGTCDPFAKKLFVTANGKILPCERINHEYFLGAVDEHGVEIDFDGIAAKYNRWYDKIVSQCRACYQSENCTQCIFYLDLSATRTKCSGFMNREDFARYVNSQVDFLEAEPGMYFKILKEVVIK